MRRVRPEVKKVEAQHKATTVVEYIHAVDTKLGHSVYLFGAASEEACRECP